MAKMMDGALLREGGERKADFKQHNGYYVVRWNWKCGKDSKHYAEVIH